MKQKIVVTGFLLHNHKALIARRALHETFYPGIWELPGGKVDAGEDPKVALQREFLEEVNIPVQVHEPYYTFSYVSQERNRHTVEILYRVSVNRVEDLASLQLSEDHMDSKWVTVDEVEGYTNTKVSQEIREGIMKGFELLG